MFQTTNQTRFFHFDPNVMSCEAANDQHIWQAPESTKKRTIQNQCSCPSRDMGVDKVENWESLMSRCFSESTLGISSERMRIRMRIMRIIYDNYGDDDGDDDDGDDDDYDDYDYDKTVMAKKKQMGRNAVSSDTW